MWVRVKLLILTDTGYLLNGHKVKLIKIKNHGKEI